MDLHKLTVFVTVAQYRSFTAAAKTLHIAQSAVSHDIAELEKDLCTKLFARTQKGVALTQAGDVFLAEAHKILSIAECVRVRIGNMSGGAGGQLKIGFVSEQMIEPLAPFLRQFRQDHPFIDLAFDAHSSPDISRLIEGGELDLAFDRKEILIRMDAAKWQRLYRDPFCLAMPDDHPLAKGKSVTMKMIEREPVIIMTHAANPGFYGLVQKLYYSRGMTPFILATSNDRMSTILMARIGMGIALLTRQFLKVYAFDGMAVLPLDEEDAFHEVGVCWDKSTPNPAVTLFLGELEAYAAGFPDGLIPIT